MCGVDFGRGHISYILYLHYTHNVMFRCQLIVYCVPFLVSYILQGEYSREALQFLDVAGLHPGAHQETLAASLE